MTTEGPLQVAENNSFSKNHISTQQQLLYFSQRENFAGPGSTDQQQLQQQQQQQTGNLMRGYSFLADQIYRSVSNPLYKLVRTVEDTVGAESTNKQPEDSFQNGYQGYQTTPSLKFESSGNFEGENDWAEANHSTTNADSSAAAYYQQQHFDSSAANSGTSTSPPINHEVSFPPAGNSTAELPSCPGCCVPPAATPHQTNAYPEAGTELNNSLCLVDPMRALPRYFTTGLWPPVINPAKLEWNGGSGVREDDARLLDMNRIYSDGSYRMTGGAAAATVYPGYVGGVQDTKDFFFTPRHSTAGDAVFRHKTEVHRLSVAAAVSAVDCDPQELEAFAERFKQRRIKLGVTQADVGKALGRLNLAGVGSFSQSTICRFESLTLSHNNMLALKPILQAWLDEAEQEAAARQKNPNAYDMEEDDKKRKRTSITDPEKRSLEAFFGIQPRPSSEKIAQIAEKLNLKKNVVRVWFCNQRQKQKRMKFSTVGLLHQVNGM
ncbi:POU domain-containing transcription factor [Echinococcus granulosus]|uniref:POU domain protein n=1 Tax=Echinococcus granulosus TaxID=6210 RepID=W6UJF0_ECHGR|nr:POU domain-containing transcription factor [Echinococcus granulosus]EUB61640.1 POU domain-containing transcription factor [Echinococcus granulosus]